MRLIIEGVILSEFGFIKLQRNGLKYRKSFNNINYFPSTFINDLD